MRLEMGIGRAAGKIIIGAAGSLANARADEIQIMELATFQSLCRARRASGRASRRRPARRRARRRRQTRGPADHWRQLGRPIAISHRRPSIKRNIAPARARP